MPTSVPLGLFVLGAFLIVIGIIGGNFKLFGAEMAATISNKWLRLLSLVLGFFFIFLALNPNPIPPSFIMSDPAINTDRTEKDYSNYQNISLEDCANKCLNQSECTAYAYRESDRQCFVKKGEGSPEGKEGITSGIKVKK